MKHKMKKSKCGPVYDGPDGVFYDFEHAEIFILEWDGMFSWPSELKIFKYYSKEYRRGARFMVQGMTNAIRLGDL